MEERSDMLMKNLAVEMASNTISLMVIRQLLERTKPGFQSEFDELFEQKWTQNGPLIIKNNYQCLLHPERSLSRDDMKHATET